MPSPSATRGRCTAPGCIAECGEEHVYGCPEFSCWQWDLVGYGKYGNMAAGVDIASGTLTRAFGRRQGRQYLVELVDKHPTTGEQLAGFQLPIWDEVVSLAKRAASAFPETRLIGSDIAITEDGPRVIEIQSDWGSNMAQLTLGRGLRPTLRDIVPRLAVSEEVKQQAMQAMGPTGNVRRWRKPPRKARDDSKSFSQQQVGL